MCVSLFTPLCRWRNWASVMRRGLSVGTWFPCLPEFTNRHTCRKDPLSNCQTEIPNKAFNDSYHKGLWCVEGHDVPGWSVVGLLGAPGSMDALQIGVWMNGSVRGHDQARAPAQWTDLCPLLLCINVHTCWIRLLSILDIYSGYGMYSDPLKLFFFFPLCYIAAIC